MSVPDAAAVPAHCIASREVWLETRIALQESEREPSRLGDRPAIVAPMRVTLEGTTVFKTGKFGKVFRPA